MNNEYNYPHSTLTGVNDNFMHYLHYNNVEYAAYNDSNWRWLEFYQTLNRYQPSPMYDKFIDDICTEIMEFAQNA
jgi:hypothetical protein